MATLDTIRHYLSVDEEGVGKYLEDFVSVPAFIYNLPGDSYLTASQPILEKLNLQLDGLQFHNFLERMPAADRWKVLSQYTQEVPLLINHRKGEPLPVFQTMEFAIRDRNNWWRKAIVKLDIAGYDVHGLPSKLFGVFWMEDTPLAKVEKVFEKPAEDILGYGVIDRINEVKRKVWKNTWRFEQGMAQLITAREKQVLQGLAQGLTTKEISNRLGISFNTVETHRKSLLKKLEARNTVHLMVKATNMLSKDFWRDSDDKKTI